MSRTRAEARWDEAVADFFTPDLDREDERDEAEDEN